jgi:hypothetical protein
MSSEKRSAAAATHRDDFLKNLPLPRRHGHLCLPPPLTLKEVYVYNSFDENQSIIFILI